MSNFLMQAIPFLRAEGDRRTGEFLSALEEVLELGNRYVFKSGGTTALVEVKDLLIGPSGIGAVGTPLLVPFDHHLMLSLEAPDHFRMPAQPPTAFRRTAFCFVSGPDRVFGMIARDDDVEPGRHIREALTDGLSTLKKMASYLGRSPSVTIHRQLQGAKLTEGVIIDEDGFRSPFVDERVRWNEVRMCEIDDRVRLTCRDAIVEVSA
ncbi:hypothetical protein [Sphingomonas sp. 3-13AW]|uniref:hypothetical protein n=1 Tax=Sphingomonas sp. 3-13AW TaxID=3050450 RepID=UPI003BB4AFF3